MASKTISIVTPSFNQAHFVEHTIQSILGQNYPSLEYVVIDGGSTDGSQKIIEKYKDKLHYYVSEPDSGHANALNKGFRQTSGEIMAWLNSDDMYVPWTFQTVAEIFEQHPDVNWIMGLPTLWNPAGALVQVTDTRKNIFDFLEGNFRWLQQESIFWRRSLWERAGAYINENYKFMVDGELWTRFFLYDELWLLNAVLGGYRQHSNNRAKDHYQTCIAEMDAAIDTMRRTVRPEQLQNRAHGHLFLGYDFNDYCWRKHMLVRNSSGS